MRVSPDAIGPLLSPSLTEKRQGAPPLAYEVQITRAEKLVSRRNDLNNTEKKLEFQRIPTGIPHGKPYSSVSRSLTQTTKFKLVTFPHLNFQKDDFSNRCAESKDI